MEPHTRILTATFLPIFAMILWQTAAFEWRFGLLASQIYIVAIVGLGAALLVFGPWKPSVKISIVAGYVVLGYAAMSVAALRSACAIGPCL